jgi:hypothetical protein
MKISGQSSIHRLLLVAFFMLACIPAACAQDTATSAPIGTVLASISADDQKAIASFQQQVKQYLDVVKQAEVGVPKGKSKQGIESLTARRKGLAASVKAARSSAKQGDIFTPDAAPVFRRLLAQTLAGPNGNRIKQSMRHAEPVLGAGVGVNESYPSGVPLQSTPASLLLNLPPLPKGLEYRVVDHALLLRDTEANVVADFLPDAFPK